MDKTKMPQARCWAGSIPVNVGAATQSITASGKEPFGERNGSFWDQRRPNKKGQGQGIHDDGTPPNPGRESPALMERTLLLQGPCHEQAGRLPRVTPARHFQF